MNFLKKYSLISFALLSSCIGVMAQDAAQPAEKTVTSSNNQLAILLVLTTIIFAFVIWGLGQVLIAFSKQIMQKNKNTANVIAIALILGLSFSTQISLAQDAAANLPAKVISNYGGLSATEFYLLVLVIAVEVLAILFLTFSIRRVYSELLSDTKKLEAAKQSSLVNWWNKMDQKLFTKAVPVEQEADVLLDHDYDGIRELDNALPPWWKYGFYITIGFAFVYILNYHVLGNGKSPLQEYQTEMANAKIAKEKYEASNKDKIDENNVPMADAAGIAKGKELFGQNCWPCHGKLGEGGAGPNLTDDYWLHKGSLNDIFHTIKNGYPDKGMQSWAVKFNPKEISELASFVKSLHGTNPPNAKAPQGELYVDGPVKGNDSAKVVKKDSVITTVKN